MRPLAAALMLALATASTAVSLGAAFSGGLPPGDGAQTRGCTCHCATADATLAVSLSGLPEAYEPARAYDLALSFTGGSTVDLPTASNEGGFALEASAGALAAKDDKTSVKEVGGAPRFATHTAAGNDLASWSLRWTAPAAGAGDVTFAYAANNVNGDGNNGNGACTDNWNKGAVTVPEAEPEEPVPDPEPEPPAEEEPAGEDVFNDTFDDDASPPGDDAPPAKKRGLLPGPGVAAVAAGAVAGLWAAGRRRR